MKPPKRDEPLDVNFKPVRIERRRYQPSAMNDEQRLAMHLQAEAIRDAYLAFRPRLLEALNAQRENCGNKSTNTVAIVAEFDQAAKRLVKDLCLHSQRDPVVWPALPSLC